MAYATQTDRTFGTAATGLRASLVERLARYRTYRQTMGELASLSDRELSDLGLTRADIGTVAREAAYAA